MNAREFAWNSIGGTSIPGAPGRARDEQTPGASRIAAPPPYSRDKGRGIRDITRVISGGVSAMANDPVSRPIGAHLASRAAGTDWAPTGRASGEHGIVAGQGVVTGIASGRGRGRNRNATRNGARELRGNSKGMGGGGWHSVFSGSDQGPRMHPPRPPPPHARVHGAAGNSQPDIVSRALFTAYSE
jgi:hypothetical protein